MELWQLRTFVAVARTLHFTQAAEELNLSQPAVSHQIKSLEKKIGEPLFIRDKNGVSLTGAGQIMYAHANKILDLADEIRFEIRENKNVLNGKITISGVTRGLNNPFSILYEGFKKKYKEIDVLFQAEYKIEDIVKKVRTGEVDIGMVAHNVDVSGLIEMPYGEYELLFVVGQNHPLAKRKEISADDIKNEEWVMFEPTHRDRVFAEESLSKIGVYPKDVFETNDGSLIKTMVARGTKVALLPAWGIFEELKNGRIISINVKELECKIKLSLIWKSSQRSTIMSALLTYLLEEKIEGMKLLKNKEK